MLGVKKFWLKVIKKISVNFMPFFSFLWRIRCWKGLFTWFLCKSFYNSLIICLTFFLQTFHAHIYRLSNKKSWIAEYMVIQFKKFIFLIRLCFFSTIIIILKNPIKQENEENRRNYDDFNCCSFLKVYYWGLRVVNSKTSRVFKTFLR